ncbi:MAG TPA: hypothetical protein VF546_10795 [Pyrinomonadaceae bacterium]|jgi:opacity protein-like surface antigen
MKRTRTVALGVALALALCGAARAATHEEEDTDVRLVGARVVEVQDEHISVVARTGVEHVIGVDRASTRVKRGDRFVSCGELRKDDVVTVDLDETRSVKFAKQIEVTQQAGSAVARAPRP